MGAPAAGLVCSVPVTRFVNDVPAMVLPFVVAATVRSLAPHKASDQQYPLLFVYRM